MIHIWALLRDVALAVSAVMMLVVVPAALMDPLGLTRFVPTPLRARVVRSPQRWPRCLAVMVAAFVGGALDVALWPTYAANDTAATRLLASTFLAIAGGIPVFLAVSRVVRTGAEHWTLYGTRMSRRKARKLCRQHTVMPKPGRLVAPSSPSPSVLDERPAAHSVDRRLRGWARSLTAAAVVWYGVGRAMQFSGHDPASLLWWGVGVAALVVALSAVWIARGWRYRAGRRRSLVGSGATVAEILQSMGMTVELPAGNWVRAMAPTAFAPKDSRAGLAPWPWAGVADTTDGRSVVVARHHGHTPDGGLKAEIKRTACCVLVPGARLPTVVVTGREGVPVRELKRAIPLESETFNRTLWAYGPDPRGVYALMHPRAMSEVMATLPDGATARFAQDCVAVYSDERVLPQSLPAYVAASLALAE